MKYDIFFLADNFPPERNAAATRVYERGVYWVKNGHQLTVLTSAPNFPEGKLYAGYKNSWLSSEDITGIKVFRVKTFIAANSGFLLRVADFLSYMVTSFCFGLNLVTKKHDFIIVTSPQFFAAISAWALAKVKRKPFIFELGDIWPESIRAVGAMKSSLFLDLMEKVELFLYREAGLVIALTHDFKKNLISRGIDGNKIFVVRNGVDLSRHTPGQKSESLVAKYSLKDKIVISYIGTLGSAHNLMNVLKAAEILKQKSIDKFVFLFVGAGAEREKLVEFKQQKSLNNVIFIESQPKEIIGDYWRLTDIALIHLKHADTFRSVIPSKMFEAMGYAKPILMVAPTGEASEILKESGAGIHISDPDVNSFVSALESMSENKEKLDAISQSSYKASARYTREKQADEFIAALNWLKDNA